MGDDTDKKADEKKAVKEDRARDEMPRWLWLLATASTFWAERVKASQSVGGWLAHNKIDLHTLL